MDELTVLCESLQQTHLQRPLLKMSPIAGDEMLRGRNPENGRHWDFGRRRRHRQSGFQHTDRPRPSSPELFNKNHNADRESLSHFNKELNEIIFLFVVGKKYNVGRNGVWKPAETVSSVPEFLKN